MFRTVTWTIRKARLITEENKQLQAELAELKSAVCTTDGTMFGFDVELS